MNPFLTSAHTISDSGRNRRLDVVERFDRLKLVPESAVLRQLLKPYELIETTSPNHSGIPEMVRVVVIPVHDDTRELITNSI